MKRRFERKICKSFTCFVMSVVLIFATSMQVYAADNQSAEKIKVSGTVVDPNGDPLIGATVIVKDDRKVGTITDFDGKYILPGVPTNATLEFSSVGMKTQLVVVNGQTTIDVSMLDNAVELGESIVIGYGSVKKSDLTGSVSSIKTTMLKDVPANSIEGLLQGRAAGLQVVNSSQDPGASAEVRIRGGSSLHGSNAPLLVVDGFPMGDAGDLKQINPADITSIEILKDASASAIYGSRGANGVIMVTTKRPDTNKTKVQIKQQITLSEFSSKLVYWDNPLLMAQLNNEQMINGGLPPNYVGATNSSGVYYPSLAEIENGPWNNITNWGDLVFRDVPVSNNTTASVTSGNKTTMFNLSLNYFTDQGKYIKDDYEKGIVKLNVDHNLFENFTIRTSNLFSKNGRDNNGGLAYWRNPIWPVYNQDGSYYLAGQNDFDHPMALTDRRLNKSSGLDYISSWLLDYQVVKWLNLKSQFNYKYGKSISDVYNPKKYTSAGEMNKGAAYMGNWEGENFSVENYATFDKVFAQKHKLNIMAGHSYEQSSSRSMSMNAYNFVNEALGNENMGAGDPEMNVISNNNIKSRLLSFMGRVNYAFDDKYLFTSTMRADGSSKFGKDNKWAYFPSTALSWKAHNESFIKNLRVFDELKARVSYGVSGNQGISPYQTLSRYGVEKYYVNGKWTTAIGPGYISGREGDDGRFPVWSGIPNDKLKWETTSQSDFGLDMAFFNRRLRATIDIYQKNTSDLLRESYLSLSSGYDRIWVNDGEVRNRGFEISLEGDIIHTKDFTLSSNLIFSKNKNEVTNLGNAARSGLHTDYMTGMQYEFWGSSIENFRQNPNILGIGQPINVFYGYKVDGIIQTAEEGAAAGLTGLDAQPGEFKYVDISGDGKIDEKDRTVIGDPNPDFLASLSLNGTYKDFDFNVFFNGVFGHDVLYQGMWGGHANIMPLRWTVDNPNNDYPSLREGRSYRMADWYIKDGSFLRIQNVSVGYNFVPRNVKWLSNIRVSANVANLHTFTKFDGYDPEVGMNGIYWGGYPKMRKFTFGIDITF